jgi:hypothetical protein
MIVTRSPLHSFTQTALLAGLHGAGGLVVLQRASGMCLVGPARYTNLSMATQDFASFPYLLLDILRMCTRFRRYWDMPRLNIR